MTKIFITFSLLFSLFGCSIQIPQYTHITAEMISKGMDMCKNSKLLSIRNTRTEEFPTVSTLKGLCEDNTDFTFKVSNFKFESKNRAFGPVGRDAIFKAQNICQENNKKLLTIWGTYFQSRLGESWFQTWFECSDEGATRSFKINTPVDALNMEIKPTKPASIPSMGGVG